MLAQELIRLKPALPGMPSVPMALRDLPADKTTEPSRPCSPAIGLRLVAPSGGDVNTPTLALAVRNRPHEPAPCSLAGTISWICSSCRIRVDVVPENGVVGSAGSPLRVSENRIHPSCARLDQSFLRLSCVCRRAVALASSCAFIVIPFKVQFTWQCTKPLSSPVLGRACGAARPFRCAPFVNSYGRTTSRMLPTFPE